MTIYRTLLRKLLSEDQFDREIVKEIGEGTVEPLKCNLQNIT